MKEVTVEFDNLIHSIRIKLRLNQASLLSGVSIDSECMPQLFA